MHDGILLEFTSLVLLAAAVGALATVLKQPLIVGFIAVGVAVGPQALDIMSDTEAWDLLSVAGISILLFVVGLRLDLDEVRDTGLVALLTGMGQVLFTSLVGFGLAMLLGLSVVPAIYVAVALTFSSTIIIVKLLSDKREIDSLHGRIAVGFLIVQDIVVVLVMIAISALGVGDVSNPFREGVEVVLKGVAMVALVAVAMRFVVRPLFGLLARVQELLVLGAIAWAMSFAVLGEQLGFSTEVGAFLAGVSLASTRFRDAIGNRLVSLRDFLLLFFFVTLGASLDLSLIGAQIGPAIVLSLFVLVGNPLIVLLIMGVLGYRSRTGFLAGLTVAQISEFSLILGSLGVAVGHIDEETLALITLVGIATIGISTYLILYSHQIYDRLAPALRRFERAVPHREVADGGPVDEADVVVLGLGRFGSEMLHRLLESDMRIMGIDFDPAVVRQWNNRGVHVRYGDAEDPEVYGWVPLGASWVVSTLPSLHANKHLMDVLRDRGYRGKFALTAHNRRAAESLEAYGAHLVLVPFADAAAQAAQYVLGQEGYPEVRDTFWEGPPPAEGANGHQPADRTIEA